MKGRGCKSKVSVVWIIRRKGDIVLQYINQSNMKNIKPVLEKHIDFEEANLFTDKVFL